MCGIAGIVSLGGGPIRALPALVRMSETMLPRGPDDEGYLVAGGNRERPQLLGGPTTPSSREDVAYLPRMRVESAEGLEGEVFLAHRRLAILDLSAAGHQPMCTPDGRYWIVYNGEIYNFPDLRRALEAEGEAFHTTCDTEVLLRGYQRWGEGVLDRTNGMFAFAIWDHRDRKIFLARDRLGIKPLYYRRDGDRLVFASDIKTLLASRLFDARPDIEGLYHALSYGVTPRPMTSFEGVRALDPGHWMRLGLDGRVESGCYWKLPHGIQDPAMGEREGTEMLESLLRRSVKRRLVSDAPVATFMSGGIDSTTVSALASKEHAGIKAFTLGFTGAPSHEVDQARATAAKNEIDHVVEFFEPEAALSKVDEMVRCYEEPFYALSPNYLIAELVAKHGVKVILNGLGGDELFAGYQKYLRVPGTKSWSLLTPGFSLLHRLWPGQARYSGRLIPEYAYHYFASASSVFSDRDKARLFSRDLPASWNSIEFLRERYLPEGTAFRDHIEAINYLDVLHTIGNHHLYRVDQFTMRFSIEGRFPLLDHELVELAFRVPSHLKIRPPERKYLLRRVAERYIDASCLEMGKKGFGLPMRQWLNGPLREFALDKMHVLESQDFLSAAEIVRYRRSLERGLFRAYQIWSLVHLQLWLETFFDDATAGIEQGALEVA